MNPRIKELMNETRIYPTPELGTRVEAFAELIVKECIDILMRPAYAMSKPDYLAEYNEGWVNGRLHGIDDIKEHFGVE